MNSRNPVKVLATAVTASMAAFVGVLFGVMALARVLSHTLDGRVVGIFVAFTLASIVAFASFLLLWWKLNRKAETPIVKK